MTLSLGKMLKSFVCLSVFALIFTILVSSLMLPTSVQYASATLYDGTKGAVSISFEHAFSNQFTAINKEMGNMTGTMAVINQRVGTSGYITQQQLLDLQARGFEIASHSETHDSISSSTSATKLYYETVQSKIDLQNRGFFVTGFIPPSNKLTTASFALIQQNYSWTEFFSPITNSTYDPRYMSMDELSYSKVHYGIYHEPVWGVGSGDELKTFSNVKAKIDYVMANKLWIAIKFHAIKTKGGSYDTNPAVFHDIINYIKQKRDAGQLLVVTRGEGVGLVNNPIPETTASPTGGTYGIAKSVSLITNIPSTIYYTVDGTDPTISSSVYSAPISITSDTTLKYFATANGLTEPIKTQTYVIDVTSPITTASPLGGIYTTIQSVSLSANEPATIYYTKDGTEPTILSFKYATVIPMSATTTLKYFAVDTVGNPEPVNTQIYNLVVPDSIAPTTTASPVGGTYGVTQNVSLTANESSTIYYSTDGIDPTTTSTVYSVPIPVTNTTLKYFAVDLAGNPEPVNTQIYTILNLPITHMIDTTASSGQNLNSARQIHAEFVSPTSQLIGDKIDTIKVKLKKGGSPTGLAEIGIFNADKSTKQLFGTKDVSTLTTSYTEYTFQMPSGSYVIQSGDRIGVKYITTSSTNDISVMRDTSSSDPFDGTASYHVYVQGTTWSSFTADDLTMTLIQTR